MIVAVVVTYNRKEILVENIESLLMQTQQVQKIIIVDNCSTDGTYELLKKRGWTIPPFVYLKTNSNIGGAGGFYTGTKAAYEEGANWIVLMDDDGKAANERTFEILINQAKKLYDENRKVFVNSLVQQGDMLSFKMGSAYTVQEELLKAKDGIVIGEANPFNATAVSRELIEEIGFPNPEFFIKGDEVDFKQRALDAGAVVATAVESRYIHPRPDMCEKTVLGQKVPFFVETPWKEYYATRNFTYMYKAKKYYKGIAFELIFVKMLAIVKLKCQKRKTIRMVLKGLFDGWKGNLGATIQP